jgi:hypothetical protein
LSHIASPFYVVGIFEIGFFCLGWLGTVIPPISTSKVARITGMSHQCLAQISFLFLAYQLECQLMMAYGRVSST